MKAAAAIEAELWFKNQKYDKLSTFEVQRDEVRLFRHLKRNKVADCQNRTSITIVEEKGEPESELEVVAQKGPESGTCSNIIVIRTWMSLQKRLVSAQTKPLRRGTVTKIPRPKWSPAIQKKV